MRKKELKNRTLGTQLIECFYQKLHKNNRLSKPMPGSGGGIQSLGAQCSTPPASGSSPSVNAQGSQRTTQQPWWAIIQHALPTSSPMRSTPQVSVMPKSGASLMGLGCLSATAMGRVGHEPNHDSRPRAYP